MTQDQLDRFTAQQIEQNKPYSDTDRATLQARYNKEQLAAIEAGEAAIPARDLAEQAAIRRDQFMPAYLDDFSRIEPVIDKKIEKIRGEGQDYENAPWQSVSSDVPDEPEDHTTVQELKIDDEHIGNWRLDLDGDAKEVWTYEGREHELDYFAEKYFKETPECQELMDRKMRHLDDPSINFMTAQELEADHAQMKKEAAEAAAEDDDEGDEADEVEEESNEDHSANLDGEEERPVIAEDAIEFDLDFSSHPKYKEIRARLEAAGPMRRKYGFGSTEPQRAIDRVVQGVEPDVAPELPRIEDPTVVWGSQAALGESSAGPEEETYGLEDEELASFQRVSKTLGQSVPQLLAYRFKVLVQNTVTNQTRLGKIQSDYRLVVAGNGAGMVGIGEGKTADDPGGATRMARLNAIRAMVPILRYENRTIYGDVDSKSGASVVQLSARSPGFGLRCNSIIFEMARIAGLHDLSARVPRSRNKMNMAKAAFQALTSQRDPEDIARARGKKMVDVRKVYYSGQV